MRLILLCSLCLLLFKSSLLIGTRKHEAAPVLNTALANTSGEIPTHSMCKS
jgi:hypothetical protein